MVLQPMNAVISYRGAVFVVAVIIAGDAAAAEVAVCAYIGVAYIDQVGQLGALAQGGVFQLHKIAHLAAIAHHAAGTDVGEGADIDVITELSLVELAGVGYGSRCPIRSLESWSWGRSRSSRR